MSSTSSAARALRALRFSGPVHRPGETGYEEQRQAPFAPIDPRPALIAEATGAADVRAAISAAREYGLPAAVQATGHGTRVPCDGGLLLKTSRMAAVLVDPDRRIARVGPGARWRAVLDAAAPFGLAPLSGSHAGVGVTGYTLGGGWGWLGRRYGLAADSVLRAQVVTADGRLITASPDSHPDLLWALRGGGGNFGVVTSLEFRLHPVESVLAGTAYFPIEGAADTLARYRDWTADAPGELSTAVLLTRAPDDPDVPGHVRGRRVLAIKAMYAGEAGQGARLLDPLWRAAGPMLHNGMRPMRYAEAEMGGTQPRRLELFERLPDPVIETLVTVSARANVEIRHWGGTIADPGPGAGGAGHRDAHLSVIVDDDPPGLAAALRPHATGGSLLNFLHDPEATETAYTRENHRRLREIKGRYDPDNAFRLGHTIPPANRAAVPEPRRHTSVS
ncbi:FAD-binding oxidoreductase [Actinomadura sp. 9N407]|uniref:FAD-binding oxidoreductase n=1 Tax=Actinomadura sp. 9N407 TaxID=3375154 RepID=UPI003797295A